MTTLRRIIATKVVDPLVWKGKRMPLAARLKEFRAGERDDPETLSRRQATRLADILAHTVQVIPFYGERLTGLTPESIEADPFGSLRHFPVLTRDDVRDHLNDLWTEMGLGTRRDHTSGSTGMPLDFYRDLPSTAAALATTQIALDWAGVERGERRVRFWGSPMDMAVERSRVGRAINLLHDRRVLDSYGMSDERKREYIDLINSRPPVAIEGYPSSVYEIVDYAEREGLALPKPRAIVVAGATLYDHMRQRFKEAFGAPVFNHYGNREQGYLAAECERHEGMHVMSETTVLEVVDGDGEPVEPGTVGDIVVTNLWNYTMPFIRYSTGDRGALGTAPCGCGRVYPLLDRVVGRTGACFTRQDGTRMIPEFFIQLLAWEFGTRDVRKFQVVQEAVDHVVIHVVPQPGAEGFSPEARKGIETRMAEGMGAPTRVEFLIEEDIPASASGKYHYTVSKIADEAVRG